MLRKALANAALIFTALAQKGWAAPCGRGYPPWMQCQSLAETAVSATRKLGELAGVKISASVQLEQARHRFFDTHPNGPGHAQAEAEFLRLLDEKDMWYLFLSNYLAPAMNTTSGRNHITDPVAAEYLDRFFGLGVKWDGGIREFASNQFDDWAAAVRRSSGGARPGAFPDMGSLFARTWKETEEPYRRYWIARYWAEFAAANHNLTDDPKVWLRLLFVITRPWNGLSAGETQLGLADSYYRLLANAFGEDAVLRAARQVMTAPKGQDAGVTLSAGQPSLWPYPAFGKALTETGDRGFMLANAIEWDTPFTDERAIPRAENTYKRLAAIYASLKYWTPRRSSAGI